MLRDAPSPQTHVSHPILELGEIPFPINKNWPPSMKVKKMKIFLNKMGLKGCKWSSLNAPGPQTHPSRPILELGEFPFPINSPLG